MVLIQQSGIYSGHGKDTKVNFTLSSSGDFQGFLNAVFERLKQFLECCEYFLPTWLASFDPSSKYKALICFITSAAFCVL